MMRVDFGKIIGKIKPMHAVNGAPLRGGNVENFHYLQEAHIPYSRLHDMGGDAIRPMVDIPRIFPNFEKDETDPASYDFVYTDILIKGLVEYGCKPYFRLGVTIENDVRKLGVKPRHINPPADFGKWARICEHIIRHYNEGWAEGFHYSIEYWDIWNEPENGVPGAPVHRANQCWTGSKEEFFELYTVTAKHLRACFGDTIKIGGYGCCTMYGYFMDEELPERAAGAAEYRMEFFNGFLKYVKEQGAPLDFFSWHSYWDFEHNLKMPKIFRDALDSYGFTETETHYNEWNGAYGVENFNTAYAAATNAAAMLAMQNLPVDMMMYYKASFVPRPIYGAMFNNMTGEPACTYYSFKAFGELYVLGNQAECKVEEEGVYAVAATDGKEHAVMITNIGEDRTLETELEGFAVYLIDAEHRLEQVDWNSEAFLLKQYQTVYLIK